MGIVLTTNSGPNIINISGSSIHPNTFNTSRVEGLHLNAAWAAYRCKQTDIQIPTLQIAINTDSNIEGMINDCDNVAGITRRDVT